MMSPPLKVMFVLPSFAAGGAERVMITLMNGLNRERFSPSMVAALESGPLQSLIALEIPYRVLGATTFLKSLPALFRQISSERPDIVFSSMAPMNFTLLLLRPFFPQVKFIVREATLPSYILNVYPKLKFVMHCAYKYLYAMASAVIAPSKIVRDQLAGLGVGAHKMHLLYNPVREMKDDTPFNKTDIGIAGDCTLFIASGRLNKQKGFDRLIEILPRLNMNWHLVILGEGEERRALEALIASKSLSEHITLAGHIHDPWKYYKAADCMVLPSRVEGLPNVVLEALACGTPVISSVDAGGAVDIAECANGNVIIANTMDDFASAMALTKPKSASNNLLPEIFNHNQIVGQFSGILDEVAKAPR